VVVEEDLLVITVGGDEVSGGFDAERVGDFLISFDDAGDGVTTQKTSQEFI